MFADGALAKRLHEQNIAYFSALAPSVRETGITELDPFLDLDGTIAFFAGDGSPLTQANGRFTAEHLRAIDDFYRGLASKWEAIVTPFSDPGALGRLIEMDATPMGWENVLYRPLDEPLPDASQASEIEIVEAHPTMSSLWSEISLRGFFGDEPNDVAMALGALLEKATNLRRYLAYWNGEPVGAASLTPGCGLGFLGGMATLPAYRGRGIQTALIRRRIEDSMAEADLAVMGALPGSSSQRNGERLGFRVAFSQVSMSVPVSP